MKNKQIGIYSVFAEKHKKVQFYCFHAPASIDQGHTVFDLSVCLCFCWFVLKNFYIGHIFWLVRLMAFIFHMHTL